MQDNTNPPRTAPTWQLGLLFGAMYFIQGIGEPTEGLISQPVKVMLKDWGQNAAQVATFSAMLALPWSIKPLYGLLTDFVPILGSRRRSYLLLMSAATALGLLAVALFPAEQQTPRLLLLMLLIPTVGVAFTDVVVDALMVENGQPLGLTGRLQAIQWACIYTATMLVGLVGGYLSHHRRADLSFLICGLMSLGTFVLAWRSVDEPPAVLDHPSLRIALHALWRAATNRSLLFVSAFLFLWNFNPFSSSVLNYYMTEELHLGELFYGYTVSLGAVASIAASVAYGFYCRRVPFRWLLHLSIVCGVITTLGYALMRDEISALIVTAIVDFTYMTAMLVQLDLAARTCPPASAGTIFALLMSLTNLSTSLAAAVGGHLFEYAKLSLGSQPAFNTLVLLGALTTACCWLLLPLLHRVHADA